MDYEMKLVKEQHEKHGLPMRDVPPARFNHDEAAARRRGVRTATDGLIRQGLQVQNIVEVAAGVAETMTASAGANVQFGTSPQLADALAAARELLEDARLVVDNALSLSEADQLKVGSCMLEIVCVGICACFNIPYKAVLDMAHAAYMAGTDIDRGALLKLMEERNGKPAAND